MGTTPSQSCVRTESSDRGEGRPVDRLANQETAGALELGFKSTFWDRKARVNIALYQTKYDDIQRQVLLGAIQTLTSAANATIWGVEVEATVKPVRALEIDGSFGYTYAKFNKFDGLDLDGIPGIQSEDGELAKKLQFDRVPKFTATGPVAYTLDVPGIIKSMTIRTDDSYRSHYFSDVVKTPILAQNGYGLLDANITADWGTYKLTLWGRSLNRHPLFRARQPTARPGAIRGEPRTYGATLGVNF